MRVANTGQEERGDLDEISRNCANKEMGATGRKDAKYMCHMIALLGDMAGLPANLCRRIWKKSSVPFCSSLTSDIFSVK